MADKHTENEQVPGIVNRGGNNTYSGTAVGKDAKVVNGKVVSGENVDDKLNNKKK